MDISFLKQENILMRKIFRSVRDVIMEPECVTVTLCNETDPSLLTNVRDRQWICSDTDQHVDPNSNYFFWDEI